MIPRRLPGQEPPLARARDGVNVGDVFESARKDRRVYGRVARVTQVFTHNGEPHVTLEPVDGQGRSSKVSFTYLLDTQFYKRVLY